MGASMRLDKFLSDMLRKTRTEIKQDIRKGCVSINGTVVKKADTKIDRDRDLIRFQGKEVRYRLFYYYMLNKPPGVISSTEKGKTKTVMDVLSEGGLICPFFEDLSPVGRLDKDTVGLLLLTNDGNLIHRLLSPKNHVDKVYFAKLDDLIPDKAVSLFQQGLDLGDFTTLPAKLSVLDGKREALVTISEGKFHQVKRMFKAVGVEVTFLKRLSMGGLALDETLKEGEFRELTDEELVILKKGCGLDE